MRLGIVTATTNPERAKECVQSWEIAADRRPHTLVVANGYGEHPYMGTVPAFREGVDQMLEDTDIDVIACLHDDFKILEADWDRKVLRHFERHPACGLLGFGGAIGLGSERLYQIPYDPMQLARIGFRSNLIDAEAHGARSLLAERVACLDGFSQVGRREFWDGWKRATPEHTVKFQLLQVTQRPWKVLADLGFVHHFYDGALGCLAARYGWETWYLPIRGKHYGGQTAVGDAGYSEWAKTQIDGGDHGFWEAAHRAGYENFRDVLPLRV